MSAKVSIGIRREDKNKWERRAPLAPQHVAALCAEGLRIRVQPSPIRAFSDDEYRAAGAELDDDLSACDWVLAVKEIPIPLFRPQGRYAFFSHTIKGQPHNMPMLRRLMELGCQLIDYERITDEHNRRLVFFGRHAGLAGMLDTLHGLGLRLAAEGLETPFAHLEAAHRYFDLEHATAAVRALAEALRSRPLPPALQPMSFGFLGYGNVSRGAQELFDLLPHRSVRPDELAQVRREPVDPAAPLLKVVFTEADLVHPAVDDASFVLAHYYQHPEAYRSRFEPFLGELDVLVNAIYWDKRYPRFVTRDALRHAAAAQTLRLRLVGDISCDIDGAIECTVKETNQDEPFLSYDPTTDAFADGIQAHGLNVMAVANLPCELPRASTVAFGEQLLPFVPALARSHARGDFEASALPPELARATLLFDGKLTPAFGYLANFVADAPR